MRIENVADLIAETLAQTGVSRVFGVVGDSLNGLTEALRKRKVVEWVHVRHEEAAAFAAAGEAQVTVDDKKATRLAVYKGSSSVASLGKTVPVSGGFGSKAEFQRAPAPPRPLPLAPTWVKSFASFYLTDQPVIDISADYQDASPATMRAAAA